MDNKPPECFACDARARGVRIDLSPQTSIVLPHEQFMGAEFSAEKSVELLKLKFAVARSGSRRLSVAPD